MIQLTFFSDFLVVFPGCAPAEPDPELSTGIAADGAPTSLLWTDPSWSTSGMYCVCTVRLR